MYNPIELKNRIAKLTLLLMSTAGLLVVAYKVLQNGYLLNAIFALVPFILCSIISYMISDIVKDKEISSAIRLFTISMIVTNLLLSIIGAISTHQNDEVLSLMIFSCNIHSIIASISFLALYLVSKFCEKKDKNKWIN